MEQPVREGRDWEHGDRAGLCGCAGETVGYLDHLQIWRKEKGAKDQEGKKIYFNDPFYLHMFRAWHSSRDPFEISMEFTKDDNRGKMVEGIVANHLIRLAFALVENKQLFDYNNNVFFWSGEKDKEVDFVLYVDGTVEVPIEVKYRQKIDNSELEGIVSFQKKTGIKDGLVLSKHELREESDYLIVPASVFLMLV